MVIKKSEQCCGITIKGRICKKKRKGMDSLFCGLHKVKDDCAICLEELCVPKKLECSHSFCKKCISKWAYLTSPSCPICRHVISGIIFNDFFEYCLKNTLITKCIYYDYIVISEESENIALNILVAESKYSLYEWKIFEKYLMDSSLYDSFHRGVEITRYCYYKKFNPDSPGIIKNGISYKYYYQIKV